MDRDVPESPFVTGFLVGRQWADGRRLILSDWGELTLLERTPAGTARDVAGAREQVPALLAERFGLAGFESALAAPGHGAGVSAVCR